VKGLKPTLISVIAMGLLAGSAVGVAAQDADPPKVAYFTGTIGGSAVVGEPTESVVGAAYEFRELVREGPIETSDPRLTGSLTRVLNFDIYPVGSGASPDEEVVVSALREGAVNFLRKPVDIEQMLLAIQKALDFQTTRRSLAYRNRDVELMQDLVVRLNRKLELIVETPGRLSEATRKFLYQLVDALPIGIVVAGSNREIIYANSHVVSAIGHSPEQLSIEWLAEMGVGKVTEEELEGVFDKALGSGPGSVETVFLSQWSFLVMTPLKLIRPDRTERFVALAIRGERM
jgi:PAS domain-containing protein